MVSQFGEAAKDGIKGAGFAAPDRVGDGQPNAMLIGHVPNGGLRHPEKGLLINAQADGLDRSDNLISLKQEGAEQLLLCRVGEVSGVVLGRQPDRIDQRIDPA